jgi:uncharacterized protein
MQKPFQFFLLLSLFYTSLIANAQDSIKSEGYQRFYFQNGVLSSEGTMKEGKPEGYWKAYYPDGKIRSEGNRKNLELDSTWKFYSEFGKLVLEVNYSKGKKNGLKISYLDKEIVKENFKDDVKQKETKIFYPDGKIKMSIPFVNGLEQGFGKEYDNEGVVLTLTEYRKGFIVDRLRINRKDKNGWRQGKWYLFWENGNTRIEGKYKDDKKEGYFKEYTEAGDLLRISKYQNDILQPEAEEIMKLDIQNEYYPDGKIKISAMSRNGLLEGVMRTYDTAGVILEGFIYSKGVIIASGVVNEDGNRHGSWKDFYADGKLRAEGKYENGKQIGIWKYFYPNGQVEQTGKFNKNGKPDGTWKWFFENGSLLREESYRNGLQDGLKIEYDETGKIIEEGEFVDGLEEGIWKETIGDCFLRGSFRDGLRTGEWVKYILEKNGSKTDSLISFKGSFTEDLPDGKQVYYWDNGKKREEGLFIMGKREGEWFQFNYDGTPFIMITYKNGVEIRYDGVKIKPPFESEE